MRKSLRDKFFKPGMLLLALLFVIGSGWSQRRLNVDREQLGLTRTTPLENAPPVLAFTTVALGGFRGLIANALWIRANELQEEGKYFEMVQLSDWITKLQPQFTTVWVHQAWNMSYNISIKFTDPEDRWLWVKRGIQLLRDEGLRYNPGEPLLYRELAWHFQHKLGHYLDDAHNEYKRYWAIEFFPIVGSDGHPDYPTLLNPQTPEQKEIVQLLREKFKMDPAWMQEVDELYGPLEWRLPETHAVYWAHVGLAKTSQDKLKQADMMALRRVIFQSMQLAFHRGRLVFPAPDSEMFFFGPNLEIVRPTNASYEEMMKAEPEQAQHISTAHANFLRTAVYFLYTHNRMQAAQQWFTYLKTNYPNSAEAKGNMDLESYAFSRIQTDVGETDPNRVTAVIEGLLETSFVDLAMGRTEAALGNELFARRLWSRFMEAVGKRSEKRMGLTPMPSIKARVQERVLNPENGLHPMLIAELRARLNLPPATNAPPTTNFPAAVPTTNQPAAKVAQPAQ